MTSAFKVRSHFALRGSKIRYRNVYKPKCCLPIKIKTNIYKDVLVNLSRKSHPQEMEQAINEADNKRQKKKETQIVTTTSTQLNSQLKMYQLLITVTVPEGLKGPFNKGNKQQVCP